MLVLASMFLVLSFLGEGNKRMTTADVIVAVVIGVAGLAAMCFLLWLARR